MIIVAAVVVAFTLTAMTIDLKTRRIPNWLTLPTLCIAVVFHALVGGWSGLGTVLGGFAVGFGLLFVLWLIGGGGGGDVKMMGALGAWLGAPLTLIVFVVSAIIAVVFSVYARIRQYTLQRQDQDSKPRTNKSAEKTPTESKLLIPYAVPVALATWLVIGVKLWSLTGTQ